MNWDDLRIVAAVKEAGSYAGAGTALRIDETTVARRLKRIERTLGFRLFEAIDGRRTPTQSCEAVLARIHAMAEHAAEIGRLREASPGPSGRFRIAATHAIAEELLAPRASQFLQQNAGLTLQFLTSSENVRFSRWEADFAIRLRKPERGDFTIARLADMRLYFFEPATDRGVEPVVCSYPDSLGAIPELQFLKGRGLAQRARFVTDNTPIIRTLIRTHQATGILPEYASGELLADPRLRATPLAKRREAWLLVQNHLKRDAAARLVIDWIRRCFQEISRL